MSSSRQGGSSRVTGAAWYVRQHDRRKRIAPEVVLDRLIADFFRAAREQGASLKQVRERLRRWLTLQPPDHFMVIEPDEELQRILIAEIEAAIRGFHGRGRDRRIDGVPTRWSEPFPFA